MTDSDVQTETWKHIPDAKWYYEASDNQPIRAIRSLDHNTNGRDYQGTVLNPRRDPDGYLVVNITLEDGTRKHGVSVARLVLLTHDPEGYFPGAEACHGPGGKLDNRRSNLRWDTKDANREEALALRMQNSPPAPKPLKMCPRCKKEHGGKGKNCHECVVKLGVDAALLRVAGVSFREAADRLKYPPDALENLAVRHGGLRFSIAAPSAPAGHTPSRLRRVLFRWQASRQNSDAQ